MPVFKCINPQCKKITSSKLPHCKHCGKQQSIPIKIPKNATKEEIDRYVKQLKLSNQLPYGTWFGIDLLE